LQKAFAKTKPFPEPGVKVKRGIKFNPGKETDDFMQKFVEGAKTGALVTLTGFVSSGSAGVPDDFDGNIELKIIARQGLDLQPYSHCPHEKELLLNHGTLVKVQKCVQKGDKWVVTVEQIIEQPATI